MKLGRIVLQVKYASIDGVGFSIWRHAFKWRSWRHFTQKKCCHLLLRLPALQSCIVVAKLKWSVCTNQVAAIFISAWNYVMAAILRVWCQIEKAHFLEERTSC